MVNSCNIVESIRRETTALTTHAALVDGMIECTYGQLLASVAQVAGSLRGAGVRPLERVAFLCEDSIDYVVGCLAILQCGAVVVPVSPSLMADELERILDRMDVNVLIQDVAVSSGSSGGSRLDGAGFFAADFLLRRREARNDQPSEYARLNPAFIRFSSGTTGDSKGVLLSHQTILERTEAADQGLHITDRDVVIWVLSMSFHFVVTILLYLRRGATVVICRQPFPESFLDAAKARKGTVFYASPFHYHVMASSPRVPRDCLANVRLAISTAMKLPAETATAFAEKFGFGLVEAYGIIEIGLPFLNFREDRNKLGSVGRALPGYEVRIVSPDPAGVGVVQMRGPGLFDAYVSPWRNREQVLMEGWFDTGDVGRLDDQGALFLLGKEKSVINFVGMKIFPQEVEEILNAHPAVADSQVYGEPHPHYGQMPCARIVWRTGVTVPEPGALRRYCFERLAPHKVPKAFQSVDHLERTISGKVRRA